MSKPYQRVRPGGQITYKTIARVETSDHKFLVISSCSKGGFTLAQQVEYVEDDGSVHAVFLKGAIHIKDLNTLCELSEAFEAAIKKSTSSMTEDPRDIAWDL